MTIEDKIKGNPTEDLKNIADEIDLGEAVLGVGTFGTGSNVAEETGVILGTSRVAGTPGNGITVTLIDIDSGLGTVLVVDSAITVEITDATTTAEQVIAWVNGDYLASELIFLAETTPGAMGLDDVITTAGGADNGIYTLDIGSKILTDAAFTLAQRAPSLHAAQQLLGDGINILNQRDDLEATDDQHIIKHSLMAVAIWDYAVDGATVGTFDLMGARNLLPLGAVIRNVFVDVVEAITSGTDTATVTFNAKASTDALTGALDKDDSTGTFIAGTVVDGTPGGYIKLAAANSIEVDVAGEEADTGLIKIYIDYVVTVEAR